jgi:hypothetical protein
LGHRSVIVEERADLDPSAGRLGARAALGAVLVLVGAATVVVVLLTPPWEANDEPDHVENATDLAAGEWYRIESPDGARPPENLERHQPPLYYMALAPIARVLDLERARPRLATDPAVFDGGARFLHTEEVDAGDRRRVWALRAPGVAVALAVVGATYLTCRRLSDDPWTPVIAAATVGFVPRFVITSGTVNNDNLANLLGALLTFGAVSLVVHPPGSVPHRVAAAAGLGAVVGALVLTKLSAVPVALGAAVAVLAVGRSVRERALLALTGTVAALAVAGWWLVRNQRWYGDPLAADASTDYLRPAALEVSGPMGVGEIVLRHVPETIGTSYVYTSGWNQLRWSWWWSLPFWILVVVGLVGLLRHVPAGRPAPHPPAAALWVLVAVAVGAFASLWLTALVNDEQASTLQARLAHPGLPAVACLVALGWERLRAPLLVRVALPVVGLVGLSVALWDDVWVLHHT